MIIFVGVKKSKIKALRQLSKMLPPSVEYKNHTFYAKATALTSEQLKNVKKHHGIVNPNSYYGGSFKGFIPINHLDRLKKAWNRNQEQGLVDYISWIDINNKKMNEKYEELKLQEVDKRIMNIVKKGAGGFWRRIVQFIMAFYYSFLSDKKTEAA